MGLVEDDVWKRRGFTILWDPTALGDVCADPSEIISLRQFFAFQKKWPEELPSSNGSATIVTGLEGCIERVSLGDAEQWMADNIRLLMHQYQDHFSDDALIFWMPGGKSRVEEVATDDSFTWTTYRKEKVNLSRALFGGVFNDANKLMRSHSDGRGQKATMWVGVHLLRIA